MSKNHIPPRYCVSIEIYDNKKDELLIEEGFNTDLLIYVREALERVIKKLGQCIDT